MDSNRQPLDQVDHSPGGMMVPMSQDTLQALLQEAGMMAPQQTYYPQPIQQQAPRRDWVLIAGMATAGGVLISGMAMLTLAIASPNAQVQRANENTALIAAKALERPTVNCVALFIPEGACTAPEDKPQQQPSTVVQPQPARQQLPVEQPLVAVAPDAPLPAALPPAPVENPYVGMAKEQLDSLWVNNGCESAQSNDVCNNIYLAAMGGQ